MGTRHDFRVEILLFDLFLCGQICSKMDTISINKLEIEIYFLKENATASSKAT